MDNLRERSLRLTGYLEAVLDELVGDRLIRIITPRDPDRRGSQLSVQLQEASVREVCRRMRLEHGVVADARDPDVIRLAPAPLYVSYHDCWRAAHAVVEVVDNGGK
jgi:kynureninase